jgi:hypothetical protein
MSVGLPTTIAMWLIAIAIGTVAFNIAMGRGE